VPRLTQVLNLLKLPVGIRREVLGLPDDVRRRFTERKLRQILKLSPRRQIELVERLRRCGVQ